MASPWLNPFANAAAQQIAEKTGMSAESFVVSTPPKPEMGDFAVGCFPAAKAMRQSPAQIAAKIVEEFSPDEWLAAASAAGPFVNFRAQPTALWAEVLRATDGAFFRGGDVGSDQTICIDYSSPNISKQLAYHHIRSTVIGQALANIYDALGYRVIRINHLGDWGTTHGMLLAACALWGEPTPLTIESLNALYVRFRAAMKEDETLEDKARSWFKRLEDGDADARGQWQRFKDVSWAEFKSAYDVLGIEFDEVKGESEYMDDVPKVLDILAEKGLSEISEGALVVPSTDENKPPLLLRKKDGATLYGTRDLAAAMYRWDTYQFAKNLYVVDRGQSLHFSQVFSALSRAGYDWAERCEHVSFGLIRLGGKKTATRSAGKQKAILLRDVFAEAQTRSKARIHQANPDMNEAKLDETATTVGVGAVVFANLASQRDKDVDFEWEAVLSVDGDSGPYLQYSYARCCSILRKAGVEPSADVDVSRLVDPLEWQLARRLTDYADVVNRASQTNEPHFICRFLLDTAADFARWYTGGNQRPALRVITDDESLTAARVALVAATKNVIGHGLGILGLGAPEAM